MSNKYGEYLYKRAKELAEKQNITIYRLAKGAGIVPQNFTLWKQGHNAPSIAHLVAIADYFQKPLDYFVPRKRGKHEKKEKTHKNPHTIA